MPKFNALATKYVFLLSSIWVLGLAGDVFVAPLLPELVRYFHTTDTEAKLAISLFILGKTVSMFICSPISESFSRRHFIYLGLGAFASGSALCLFAPGINTLLIGRFLQGFGVSINILMGRSVINDNFSSKFATIAFSYIFAINAIIVVLLPILGGYIATLYGVTGTFLCFFIYSLFTLTGIYFFLPKQTTQTLHLSAKLLVERYRTLVINRQFWGFVLACAFMTAGEKAYLTSSPFLFKLAGLSQIEYGYINAVIWSAHLLGTLACGLLIRKMSFHSVVRLGVILLGAPALLLLVNAGFGMHSFVIFMSLMFVFMLGTGFFITLTAVGIVQPFPTLIGFATAFGMCLEFVTSTLSSSLISYLPSTIINSSLLIGAMGCLAFVAWYKLIKNAA